MRRFPVLLGVMMLAGAPAVAAPEAALPQAGSWVVGPIGDNKICSMKNAWQGGRKLVFARDAAGTNSLALDYGADVLEPGRQYPVTLDLPPMLTRELTAVGATRQVLLVALGGKDREFFDALGRMKSLYVTALGHDDGYALTGSGEALQELSVCAASLKGAKPAPVAKRQIVKPETNVIMPTAEVALAHENAALRRKLAETEARAAAEKEKLAARLAAAARTEQDNSAALEKQLEDAKSRAKSAEAAIEKLKVSLSDLQEGEGKSAALEKQLAELKSSLAAVQKAQDKDNNLAEKLAEAQARAKAAEAASEKLKARLAVVPAAEKAPVKKAAKVVAVKEQEDRLRGILGTSGVMPEDGRATAAGRTFRWESDSVLGSAEESAITRGETFRGKVTAWLGRMAGRCKGDFAHTDGPVTPRGGVTTQTVEIACLGDTSNAAAALLFVGDDATFSAVMYETAPEAMPLALAQRNAAVAAVR